MSPKNSKINDGRQAKNGGVKGRDRSAEELDRETGQEQITVGWTRRKDVVDDRLPKRAAELREQGFLKVYSGCRPDCTSVLTGTRY